MRLGRDPRRRGQLASVLAEERFAVVASVAGRLGVCHFTVDTIFYLRKAMGIDFGLFHNYFLKGLLYIDGTLAASANIRLDEQRLLCTFYTVNTC